jgi:hypothetical protein
MIPTNTVVRLRMRLRNQNEFIRSVLELTEDKLRRDCVVGGEYGVEDSPDVLAARVSSCVAMRARRTTEISPESWRRDL